MEKMVGGVDMVMGMDMIFRLGGVKILDNQVEFGNICAVAWECRFPDIQEKDFEAFFDGKSWEVRYFWTENGPPVLKNRVGEYDHKMPP